MPPARGLLHLLVAVNAVTLGVMLVLLGADIAIRYLQNSSIRWLHETSSIVFSALYLLGTVEVYARRKDVDLDVVGPMLRGRAFHLFAAMRHLALAVTFLVLAWFGWVLMGRMAGDLTPLLRLPSALYQIPVVVCGLLVAAFNLLDMLACLIGAATGIRPETIDGGDDED